MCFLSWLWIYFFIFFISFQNAIMFIVLKLKKNEKIIIHSLNNVILLKSIEIKHPTFNFPDKLCKCRHSYYLNYNRKKQLKIRFFLMHSINVWQGINTYSIYILFVCLLFYVCVKLLRNDSTNRKQWLLPCFIFHVHIFHDMNIFSPLSLVQSCI